MPLDLGYEPPAHLPPLLRGLLTTCHERHVDMANLVAGLPAGALEWRPFPESASLAGLALHILDVEEYVAKLVSGIAVEWAGENGSRMDESASSEDIIAAIERVDAWLRSALEAATPAVWVRPHPGAEDRTIGQALVEELDHSAMHYGHMQLTRHAWEAGHPEAERTYVHWR